MTMKMTGAVLAAAVLGLAACNREEPAPSEPAGGEPADAPETAEAAPAGQPELREGLWVVTSQMEDLTTTMRMCVDADVQRRMSVLGSQMAGGACEEAEVSPRPGGVERALGLRHGFRRPHRQRRHADRRSAHRLSQ